MKRGSLRGRHINKRKMQIVAERITARQPNPGCILAIHYGSGFFYIYVSYSIRGNYGILMNPRVSAFVVSRGHYADGQRVH